MHSSNHREPNGVLVRDSLHQTRLKRHARSLRLKALKSLHDPTAILVAVPVSIVIVVGTMLSLQAHALARRDRELVLHSYEVINASNRLLLALADAETGQRGFLITGDPQFRQPYEEAINGKLSRQMERLGYFLEDNPVQKERVRHLHVHTDRKLKEMATSIRLFSSQGFPQVQVFVAKRTGKEDMDAIRSLTREIQTAEETLVRQHSEQVRRDERRIVFVAIATTAVSTLLRILIALWRRSRLTAAMRA